MHKDKKVIRWLFFIHIFVVFVFLEGCSEKPGGSRGVYMLLDISGTYAAELKKARMVTNFLLGTLQPGETLAIGRIDTSSFSEKAIIAKVTFSDRPSMANNQKRAFQKKINNFVENVKGGGNADISGGILQAIDFLNESGASHRYILIFSDLQEELTKGYVRGFPFQLEGFTLIVLNVVKFSENIHDLELYKKHVAEWQANTEKAKGRWKVINGMEQLNDIFSN